MVRNTYIVCALMIMTVALYGCGFGIDYIKKDNSTTIDNNTEDNSTSDGKDDTDSGDKPVNPDKPVDPTPVAPKPIKRLLAGGIITSDAAHSSSGGLWYSDDNGTTWSKAVAAASSGLDLTKSWISFADLGGGVVLAGSGKKDFDRFDTFGYGIIRSEDYGKTWNKTDMTDGVWSSLVYVDGDIVLAGAGLGNYSSFLGGIWRSEDGGKTWKVSKPLSFCDGDGGRCTGLVTTMTSINTILKVKTDFIIAATMARRDGYPVVFVYSRDAGVSWQIFDQWSTYNNAIPVSGDYVNQIYDLVLASGRVMAATSKGMAHSWDISGIEADKLTSSLMPSNFYVRNGPELSFLSVTVLKSGRILAGNTGDQFNKGLPTGIYKFDKYQFSGFSGFYQTNMRYGSWLDLLALDDGSVLGTCETVNNVNECSGIWKSTDDGNTWTQILKDKKYYKALAIVRGE